jgi:hypothetical protein
VSTDKDSGEELPVELKTLESALQDLTPRTALLDRDRLMYLAGQASVANSGSQYTRLGEARPAAQMRRNWWPMATAALALVSITFGGLLLHVSRPGERIVVLELPRAAGEGGSAMMSFALLDNYASVSSVRDNADYLQLRNLVLKRGVNALPATPTMIHTVEPELAQPFLPALRHQWLGRES